MISASIERLLLVQTRIREEVHLYTSSRSIHSLQRQHQLVRQNRTHHRQELCQDLPDATRQFWLAALVVDRVSISVSHLLKRIQHCRIPSTKWFCRQEDHRCQRERRHQKRTGSPRIHSENYDQLVQGRYHQVVFALQHHPPISSHHRFFDQGSFP